MEQLIRANIEKLITKINQFTTKDGRGINRLALSSEELSARNFLISYMKELGMEVSIDGIGNIFGCYKGRDDTLAPVWSGSHLDTVKEAGMFDGVAGIVTALEVIRCLKEEGICPLRSIYVNIYTCEESAVFGAGCVGSRALAGHMQAEELNSLCDFKGKSLADYLKQCGYFNEANCQHLFGNDLLHPKASVELHIEQGPWLERTGNSIGIVDSICAPTNIMVSLKGEQSHAGGTSMQDRRDAFAALAEISMALEDIVADGESDYSTGTIGYVSISPNAVNVIPGEVNFSIDIRDCDEHSKNVIEDNILARMKGICQRRNIEMTYELKARDIPMKCDASIQTLIEESCKEREISNMHMISGAYHDSLFLGELCPVAMIFVPSKNGISHSPEEWTDYDKLAEATLVLKDVLLKLAQTN